MSLENHSAEQEIPSDTWLGNQSVGWLFQRRLGGELGWWAEVTFSIGVEQASICPRTCFNCCDNGSHFS